MEGLLSKRLEGELRNDLERGTIVWNELGIVNRAIYACRLGVSRRALPQGVLQRFDCFGPKKASTESVLRSMLEQDFQNGDLTFSRPGFIDKRHYANRAACSNTQYYKKLFDEYEAKAGAVPTSIYLVQLLSRDFAAGTLPFSRGGKIDRSHYAVQLGVTKSGLTPHIPVFQVFETKLRGTGRYRDDDLEKMAKWLETNFEEGLLRFNTSGKLVRQQFKDAFGITGSDFETRYPAVGGLIQKYEALHKRRLLEASSHLGAAKSNTTKKRISAKAECHLKHEVRPGGPLAVSEQPPSASFSPQVAASQSAICNDIATRPSPEEDNGAHDDFIEKGPPRPAKPSKSNLNSQPDRFGLASQPQPQPQPNVTERTTTGSKERLQQLGVSSKLSTAEPAATSKPAGAAAATTPENSVLMSKHPALRKHQFYEVGSTRQRLVEMLNQHFDHDRSAPLVQRKLAIALNVTETSISINYRDVVKDYRDCANGNMPETFVPVDADLIARYPGIEKHQYYPSESTRGRLVTILNKDLVSGTIPRSRGGKIDRQALSARFAFASNAMSNYVDILRDYESATGGLHNRHARRLPEMEAFLAASFQDGTLEVRNGKVARLQFHRHFGLPENKTILVRNPAILALLKRYDDLVKSTGYLPNRIVPEIKLLRAVLKDDPPIFKTGLSIDRKSISRITKISLGRIVRPPFAQVLEDADIRLVQHVESDDLCRVFAGRLFTLRSLLDSGWSHQFLNRVADGFQKIYGTKSPDKAKVAYNSLNEILRYIGGSDDPSCRAVQSALNIVRVRSVRPQDWTLATQAYSTWIDDRDDLKGGTSKTKLGSANNVLRHLGNLGVFPELEMALRAKGEASSHRRTLAQAPASEGVDDYLAFATAMLHEAAKLRQVDIDTDDEAGFLQTLRAELSSANLGADDSPAKVILHVLKRRLKLIEDALAAFYVRWRRKWERGQELLQVGESVGADWEQTFFAGSRNEYVRRSEMRAFFPVDDSDRATANLIRLVSDKFNGIYPSQNQGNVHFGQFFAKRALELGGKVELQAMIMPHPHAVYALILLYLCGSGANMAVGRTLFVDAMEPSQIAGATHITGEKARASGKPIHAHLDTRSHAVMGMNWLLQASASVRLELDPDDRKLLFVVNQRSVGQPVEEYNVRAFLKRVADNIPEIAELGITPAMLRPTVLLIAALEGDADAHRAAALGQHGLNVGRGYIAHPPTRYMHDEGIRDFVDSFEVASFHPEQDVTEWLGFTKADMDVKIDNLMETGLGTFCRDLHGRPGNDGGKCRTFDCWNSCPQLVVIARRRELAFLIIWRASLIEAEPLWIVERKERWYALWFPWLEFIQTVERKILLTAMGRIWREATVIAEKIMAQPDYIPIRPY